METMQEFHRQDKLPIVFAERYNAEIPESRRLFKIFIFVTLRKILIVHLI